MIGRDRSKGLRFVTLGVLLAALGTGATRSAPSDPPACRVHAEGEHAAWVRANYTKFEHRAPMRDGAELFTAVYVPNDRSTTYPFVLTRTPYSVGPYGPDRYRGRLGPAVDFDHERFIFVFQDVRGRFMSDGTFVNMRPTTARASGDPRAVDESTDTYDTIEWLLENVAGHNGRVGLWGNSYGGFYAAAGAIDGHEALRAVSPQAPIADWFFDDMHRHGAFNLKLAFRFFSSFGRARDGLTREWPERFDFGTPDGYRFFLEMGSLANADGPDYLDGEVAFWSDIAAHPNYDAFWQARDLLRYLSGVRAAVLVVGGWFDTEDLYGPLAIYETLERENPEADVRLVMGPWCHGCWNRTDGESLGDASFGFPTAVGYRRDVQLPFFVHHLKDGPAPSIPEALAFEVGANRWRAFDAWPPSETRERALWLREGFRLLPAPPEPTMTDGPPAGDRYPSDPAKPVPYTQEISTRWSRTYVVEDQRFAARRPDVLVYRSEPLEAPLTIAGPIRAELYFSTDRTAADVIVKVIDEFPGELEGYDPESGLDDPGGTQRLVRAEAFRGRFRESYERPVPFRPGEPAKIAFDLWDTFHTFKTGHRVMIQVQSTWFPYIDRNPQSYVPNIFEATEEDFVPATHTIYRDADLPSRLVFRVLE